jgi:hypothetical protein
MNKISFTIPNQTITNKIEPNKPLELTNKIIVNPKIIKKNIDYKKIAPNVYLFC